MKNRVFTVIAFTGAVLLIPQAARAHHGWAAFSSGSQITLQGKVIEFHFVNPHCIVEFEVKDNKGLKQLWEGELSSPGNLTPRGWTATSLEDKEEITITGYPAKNGSRAVRVTRIVLSNRRELKVGGGS
jgi:hypothetical protein